MQKHAKAEVGLPEDIVKMAALCAMSPLDEVPADLHLLEAAQVGQLRITDPLKSFVKVVTKQLKWRVHYHANAQEMAEVLGTSPYPPYFLCVQDRHMVPLEVLQAVAKQGGYFYERLPSDGLSLFRAMTTSQAWTVACTEQQLEEAKKALSWSITLPDCEIVKPKPREDLGGGFGDTGDVGGNWDELSDDEESEDEASAEASAKATA